MRIARLIGLGTLLWLGLARAGDAPVETISADELLAREAQHDPALVVLDVRTPEEYAEGHVPGARNVPHDQIASRLAELARFKDQELVVYCKSGRRAGLALEVLARNGYGRLRHLDGDMQAWSAAGRPVERGNPPPEH